MTPAEKTRMYRERQRARLRELKESTPCSRCGEYFPYYVTDYHHRDPADKSFKISVANQSNMAWDRVQAEIDKCDLLCANCHRIEEYSSRCGVNSSIAVS